MKKILALGMAVLLCANMPFADVTFFMPLKEDMSDYWEKNGNVEQKIMEITNKVILANGLKRAPAVIQRDFTIANAYSDLSNKRVTITKALIKQLKNEDEVAFVLSHELSHSQEAYDGFLKIMAMSANSKGYEYKADLHAVDYMVKAGYNPIAGMIVINNTSDEPLSDWGFWNTHPKGSNRLIKMYEYIYVKYPQYLNSPMTKDVSYVNFLHQQDYDIKKFEQKQKKRQLKQGEGL